MRLRVGLALLTVAAAHALLGLAGAERARADAPPERRTAAEYALKRLSSPVLDERRAGVRALVALLPGVRERVIEALPGAPWGVQVHLIEVLGEDGSDAAIQALVDHLVRTEATQAVLIQTRLARNRSAATSLLGAWRKDPKGFLQRGGEGQGAERLGALVRLIRRAEIEELFLGRKSKSGSTGYYKGQYDVLQRRKEEEGYREQALAVVTGIALDEAIPTPGIYTSGLYRFVRPHHIDEWELKSMALNAVGELCTKEDKAIIERLEKRLVDVMGVRADLKQRMQIAFARSGRRLDNKPFQDALMEWDDALGEYLDQLACLYQVEPDRYAAFVRRFITELKNLRRWPFIPLRRWSLIAGLLIRVGWYDEALEAYRLAMRNGSKAIGYYNMACASASASRKVGLSTARKTGYLDDALMYLSFCIDAGWSDIAWMNEDRDLEPLRKERGSAYAQLVERIKREWHVPPREDDEQK